MRTERELAAIRVLKSQLAVLHNAGTVQNAARTARVRPDRTESIYDRRGAIRRDILDDQRGTEKRRPGGVAPYTEKRLVTLRYRLAVDDAHGDRLMAEDARGRGRGEWLRPERADRRLR